MGKSVIILFALPALLALGAVAAPAADAAAASVTGGIVIAQAPPGHRPPPSGASPQSKRQLNCNVRQTNCANICNTRYHGAARNACYNRCNAEYIRCTQKTNRLPAK